jgi:hypothetical protein
MCTHAVARVMRPQQLCCEVGSVCYDILNFYIYKVVCKVRKVQVWVNDDAGTMGTCWAVFAFSKMKLMGQCGVELNCCPIWQQTSCEDALDLQRLFGPQ